MPAKLRKVTKVDRERHYQAMMKLLPNKEGKFQKMPKNKLGVDKDYQRELNLKQVERMAKNFHWALFGAIYVAKRTDGSYYIFDGQHRWEVARRNDDITDVPCLIWEVETEAAEAAAFNLLGQERTRAASYDRFKTEIVSGDPLALSLKIVLDKYRLKVGNAAAKQYVASIDRLKTMYQTDPDALDKALYLYVKVVEPEAGLKGQIISGLHYLARENPELITEERIKDKLYKIGEGGLSNAISRKIAEIQQSSPIIYARAIQGAINKGLRGEKLQLNEKEDKS